MLDYIYINNEIIYYFLGIILIYYFDYDVIYCCILIKFNSVYIFINGKYIFINDEEKDDDVIVKLYDEKRVYKLIVNLKCKIKKMIKRF